MTTNINIESQAKRQTITNEKLATITIAMRQESPSDPNNHISINTDIAGTPTRLHGTYSSIGTWALASNYLRSRIRKGPVTIDGHAGCPHLLVVSFENSFNLGPAWIKKEAKRGAHWRWMRDLRGNHVATAATGVSKHQTRSSILDNKT
jgi:hypothetical protein